MCSKRCGHITRNYTLFRVYVYFISQVGGTHSWWVPPTVRGEGRNIHLRQGVVSPINNSFNTSCKSVLLICCARSPKPIWTCLDLCCIQENISCFGNIITSICFCIFYLINEWYLFQKTTLDYSNKWLIYFSDSIEDCD